MVACQNGHKDVVKLFLEHPDASIDLNAKTDSGETALMFAFQRGHEDIVQLIKSKLTLAHKLDF